MSLPPGSPTHHANRLRVELRRRQHPDTNTLTTAQLAGVALRVKDIELAADAIFMWPRPGWLQRMIGPGSMPQVEMLHSEDRAHPGDWGPLG